MLTLNRPWRPDAVGLSLSLPQKLRQLGDIRRNPPRLVALDQIICACRSEAASAGRSARCCLAPFCRTYNCRIVCWLCRLHALCLPIRSGSLLLSVPLLYSSKGSVRLQPPAERIDLSTRLASFSTIKIVQLVGSHVRKDKTTRQTRAAEAAGGHDVWRNQPR